MIRNNKYKIMKPKRRVYCYLANRQKMCFETEGEALKFIEYNSKNPKEWDQGKSSSESLLLFSLLWLAYYIT